MTVSVAGSRVARMCDDRLVRGPAVAEVEGGHLPSRRSSSCCHTGRSSPELASGSRRSAAGLEISPVICSAGSPPTALKRKNTSRMTPTRVGTICQTRRMRIGEHAQIGIGGDLRRDGSSRRRTVERRESIMHAKVTRAASGFPLPCSAQSIATIARSSLRTKIDPDADAFDCSPLPLVRPVRRLHGPLRPPRARAVTPASRSPGVLRYAFIGRGNRLRSVSRSPTCTRAILMARTSSTRRSTYDYLARSDRS